MQVISGSYEGDSQHSVLLNLFQKFIDVHSDNQNNTPHRQIVNQNMKREWNYFKEFFNVLPLNTDKISSYFHLLEKNQIANLADSSPVHSPTMRPSQNQIASSKSPNARILTINPKDVPKDAFKKNCFKKSANTTANKQNNNEQPSSTNSLPFDGFNSPQIQVSSQQPSDNHFSSALNQFEKNIQNSRSQLHQNQIYTQNQNTGGASALSNNQYAPISFGGSSNNELQHTYQQYTASSSSANTIGPESDSSSNKQRGLIRLNEETINAPTFPIDTMKQQQQLQQQQQQSQQNMQVSKFNYSNINAVINSEQSSNEEQNSTRNSYDVVNNISNYQTNSTTANTTNSPSTTEINQTSLQIKNLKNQTQQFYKDYKNNQQSDLSRTQQHQSNDLFTAAATTTTLNVQQFSRLPIIPFQPNKPEGQNNQANHHLQITIPNNQPHSQSLDHNQQNQHPRMQTIHHLRALSPSPQSTQYNNSSRENRVSSGVRSPQLQSQQFGSNHLQQPSYPTKNALNYKNKLLQAANQAVPLNQLSRVYSPVPQQTKSESFSNAISQPQATANINNHPQQTLQQMYGLQNNNYLQGQRSTSPMVGFSPRKLQEPNNNFTDQQQAVIDEMIRYQFKTKQILEKTQLLEKYMTNNSAAFSNVIAE